MSYYSKSKYMNRNNTNKRQGENKMSNRKDYGKRYLAKGIEVSNDMHLTQLANHDFIIGCSGSGKTTSYVYNNLIGRYSSYVITDTKGNLEQKFGPMLKRSGYDVKTLDLMNINKSIGYNPMDYIRWNDDCTYNEQDVQKLASLISPNTRSDDTFHPPSRSIVSGYRSLRR